MGKTDAEVNVNCEKRKHDRNEVVVFENMYFIFIHFFEYYAEQQMEKCHWVLQLYNIFLFNSSCLSVFLEFFIFYKGMMPFEVLVVC